MVKQKTIPTKSNKENKFLKINNFYRNLLFWSNKPPEQIILGDSETALQAGEFKNVSLVDILVRLLTYTCTIYNGQCPKPNGVSHCHFLTN